MDLKRIVKVQREIKEVLKEGGVISTSDSYTHLRIETFLNTFANYGVAITDVDTYPIEFHATVEGFRFLAVTNQAELERLYKGD